MVFPFGVSVGDFITGIKLFKDAVESLSESRGARADYAELRQTLNALQRGFDATSKFDSECVTDFLVKTGKFEILKENPVNAKSLKVVLRKLEWILRKQEDVSIFKAHLDTHVGVLQLLLLIFQINAQFSTTKTAEDVKKEVDLLASQMAHSMHIQDDMAKEAKDASSSQSQRITRIEQQLESSNAIIATQPSQLSNIQQHLQSGLSAEQQNSMFNLLEEVLAANRLLVAQNNTIYEELKAATQVQREIPPQVLLRRPVILIDPFDGNRLPFHLEFINSFEALYKVLAVRFKDRGESAVDRIRRQLFNIYESSQQRLIDTNGPWRKAFQPGQHSEMSMLFPARSDLNWSHCPRCDHKEDGYLVEGQKVEWQRHYYNHYFQKVWTSRMKRKMMTYHPSFTLISSNLINLREIGDFTTCGIIQHVETGRMDFGRWYAKVVAM
ncbi:hypothetical protein K505DRAFT_370195 [Melanomma pulvis-pyrius CBS 109.77]|uniref:Ubiquitin-like domain-containing protein n=1 Tax=Melanomma pulvis-pyrius CBS 109.77 TaxID=1314802 RepID=A0A6A6XXQ3_9PLEO|nr:hypothetical protein K505DRAFT_370195 [Melanomma pulvis-pyrius CBS 109.77]